MSRLASGGGAVPASPPAGRVGPGGAPISRAAFLAVGIVSIGGPLALVAALGPQVVIEDHGSPWFSVLGSVVAFVAPLLVWLRYGSEIASAGGLYAFVEAAAGRRVARVQAAVWILSYLLYLVYTSAAIVNEILPVVLPGVVHYRAVLGIAIPVAIALVVLAGRAATMAVIGLLAVGQLVLVVALGVVAAGHGQAVTPFGSVGGAGSTATAAAQTSLLYICGSLPLFLGGEIARPARTMRHGLVLAFLVAAASVVVVVPLVVHDPNATGSLPGASVAQAAGHHGLAVAIGVGVAVSTAGVMLVEYTALSRLLHAMTGRSVQRLNMAIAAVLVATSPLALPGADELVENLGRLSLYALWVSQFIAVAVYPRFAMRRHRLRVTDVVLSVLAMAFCVYGFVSVLQSAGSS